MSKGIEILSVFLLSALPISELRGGIPLGIGVFRLNPWLVFSVAILGNLAPVIPILLFLEPISNWLGKKSSFFKNFFQWLFERTRKKHSDKMERFGALGLAIFVAIPSPGTGAWTGCLIAFLLGMRFRYAFGAIVSGVIGAGILVTTVSLGFFNIFRWLGSPWLSLGMLLVLALIIFAFRKSSKKCF